MSPCGAPWFAHKDLGIPQRGHESKTGFPQGKGRSHVSLASGANPHRLGRCRQTALSFRVLHQCVVFSIHLLCTRQPCPHALPRKTSVHSVFVPTPHASAASTWVLVPTVTRQPLRPVPTAPVGCTSFSWCRLYQGPWLLSSNPRQERLQKGRDFWHPVKGGLQPVMVEWDSGRNRKLLVTPCLQSAKRDRQEVGPS